MSSVPGFLRARQREASARWMCLDCAGREVHNVQRGEQHTLTRGEPQHGFQAREQVQGGGPPDADHAKSTGDVGWVADVTDWTYRMVRPWVRLGLQYLDSIGTAARNSPFVALELVPLLGNLVDASSSRAT